MPAAFFDSLTYRFLPGALIYGIIFSFGPTGVEIGWKEVSQMKSRKKTAT